MPTKSTSASVIDRAKARDILQKACCKTARRDYAQKFTDNEEDLRACIYRYVRATLDADKHWRLFLSFSTRHARRGTARSKPDLVFLHGSPIHNNLSLEILVELKNWPTPHKIKRDLTRGALSTFECQKTNFLSILTTPKQNGGAPELIERLRQQVGRLDVVPEELEGRNQRSALFKTMFLAFRADGAKDWRSNLAISHDHSGTHHKLQFHHIFPKAVLKGTYQPREADDISNLAFIGGKTNRAISDKPPVAYFPTLIEKAGVAAFTAQRIPTDPSLLELAIYKAFLTKRRELIAQRLNEFLGTTKPTSTPS